MLSEGEGTELDPNLCYKPHKHRTGSCLASLKGSTDDSVLNDAGGTPAGIVLPDNIILELSTHTIIFHKWFVF